MARSNNQPCWSCTKFICGCSWSERGVPVDGWMAEEDKSKCGIAVTYAITHCPEYDKDEKAVKWEIESGLHKNGRGRSTEKRLLKATDIRTGEERLYQSFAAAAKDGFHAWGIIRVLDGAAAQHKGWRFDRV